MKLDWMESRRGEVGFLYEKVRRWKVQPKKEGETDRLVCGKKKRDRTVILKPPVFMQTEVSYLELFQLWLTCREKKNMGPSLCWKAKGASEKESLAVCSPPSCIRDIHSSLLKVRLLVLRRDRDREQPKTFSRRTDGGWSPPPPPPPPFSLAVCRKEKPSDIPTTERGSQEERKTNQP